MAQKMAFLDEAQTWTGAQTSSAAITGTAGGSLTGGNVTVGAAGDKIAMYGAAPVGIRASTSIHQASNVSAYSSTTASALIGAFLAEVAATLVGLGIWI